MRIKFVSFICALTAILAMARCSTMQHQQRNPNSTSEQEKELGVINKGSDVIEVGRFGTVYVDWKRYKEGAPRSVAIEVSIQCNGSKNKSHFYSQRVCFYDGYNFDEKDPNILMLHVYMQKEPLKEDEPECNDPRVLDVDMTLQCPI
ncbi:MAG: hypothetical protein KDD33_10300 [Bdellovibrionales bacterium]|nr:hypothetical protein [Bdellovibrionales bacterium]